MAGTSLFAKMLVVDLLAESYRIFLFDEDEEYEDAIARLTEHLAAHPHDGTAYNNRGVALSETGRGLDALADFSRAIELSPGDPMPLINRGNLYERYLPEGKFNEAIEDYSRAISIKGDDSTFHHCKAYACMEVERYQEAIESFMAALRLRPDFRRTYMARAKAYRELGETEKAEADLRYAATLPVADLLP